MSISLTVTPADNVQVYAVEEQLPMGWTALSQSLGDRGYVDPVNRKLKWGPFYDHTARPLSYVVAPPVDASYGVQLNGTASFDGVNVAITGPGDVAVGFSLRALGWTTEGALRLRLAGGAGARVRIEFSADLEQWERLTELTDTVGPIEFTDPVASGIAHCFYRARWLE